MEASNPRFFISHFSIQIMNAYIDNACCSLLCMPLLLSPLLVCMLWNVSIVFLCPIVVEVASMLLSCHTILVILFTHQSLYFSRRPSYRSHIAAFNCIVKYEGVDLLEHRPHHCVWVWFNAQSRRRSQCDRPVKLWNRATTSCDLRQTSIN